MQNKHMTLYIYKRKISYPLENITYSKKVQSICIFIFNKISDLILQSNKNNGLAMKYKFITAKLLFLLGSLQLSHCFY